MLKVEYIGPPMLHKQSLERMEKHLREQITKNSEGFTMRSQSGTSLAMAMSIFEELKKPYSMSGIPGVGYHLHGEPEFPSSPRREE